MTRTWAVMATRGRDDVARRTYATLRPQVDGYVVVDNNPTPAGMFGDSPTDYSIHTTEQPPNLSRFYNQAMTVIANHEQGEWNVAIVNDDVLFPNGWAATLGAGLRSGPYAAAYIDRGDGDTRMTCWACMVRGELRLTWDEDLLWWYGDNAFERVCRATAGGVVAVPAAARPQHLHPDQQTYTSPALSAQAHQDAATFAHKYGS